MCLNARALLAGHGMEWNGKWNGMENGMERKFRYGIWRMPEWNGMENGMERKFRYGIWKMPEWNGIEDFKSGIEDNLPYFHTNSILDFAHGIYRKIYTDSND